MNTRDGRAVLDVPLGVISEPLTFSITTRDKSQLLPAPDQRFVGRWDVTAADQDGVATHQFSGELTLTMHFAPSDLEGRNPDTIAIWSSEDGSSDWQPVASSLNAQQLVVVGQTHHFTEFGATSDKVADIAPLLNGRDTDIRTGASRFSVPLAVPPGRGGLAPSLDLSYDSGRVSGLSQYTSTGSWVGQGWDLDTGSISLDWDHEPTQGETTPMVSLQMAGVGGELFPEGKDASGVDAIWRLKDENYYKIRTAMSCGTPYVNGTCAWTVTDQHGTQYVFGGSDAFARFYWGVSCQKRYYRLDLASIQDVNGNRVDFEYDQQAKTDAQASQCSGGGQYVASAYPQHIYYNFDSNYPTDKAHALVHIQFTTGSDACNGSWCFRNDAPRDVTTLPGCTGSFNYVAPKVVESRKLMGIDVKVAGTQQRHYDFTYNQTSFDGGMVNGLCEKHAGNLNLSQLTTKGSGTSALSTMAFAYQQKQTRYYTSAPIYGPPTFSYNWPYLTQADNGFGGSILFSYTERPATHWTRMLVTQELHRANAGQPDVTTTFRYGSAPTYGDTPDYWPTDGTFSAEFRGFRFASEFDAVGNQTVHEFYTVGSAGVDEPRTGREISTTVLDASGVQWAKTVRGWSVRPVANEPVSTYLVNFVYPSQIDSYLKDGTDQVTKNTFDGGVDCTPPSVVSPPLAFESYPQCFGLQTKVEQYPTNGAHSTADYADVITNTAYNKNTSGWVFVPRRVEKTDPQSKLWSCTRSYYDGSHVIDPASPPSIGLLTATSTITNDTATTSLCETGGTSPGSFTTTNSYTVYDSGGNVTQQSVATDVRPEGATGSGTTGWIPSGVASTVTTYDGYKLLPTLVAQPSTTAGSQKTKTYYDGLQLKPVKVVGPYLGSETDTGVHVVETSYDEFGRQEKVWDNAYGDSSTSPTGWVTYDWGSPSSRSAPVRTVVTRRMDSTRTREQVSCVDGFGREVETRSNAAGPDNATIVSVRTDYDTRGTKAVVANPTFNGTNEGCGNASAAISVRDRVATGYDTLGNATSTTYLKANESSGPTTRELQNGLTTISMDEKGNTVTKVTNPWAGGSGDPFASSQTVYEPDPTKSIIVRPAGTSTKLARSQWTSYPTTTDAHYTNVDESAPDDDTSYDVGTSPGLKDSYVFGTASATGNVQAVILHFRWKHYNAAASDPPSPGLYAVFTERHSDVGHRHLDGVEAQSPGYHRSNAQGWGDDEWVLPTNPVTAAPWTLDEVNGDLLTGGIEFGFKVGEVGAQSRPYLTQVYAEIITDATTAATTYQYDRVGQLVGVLDALGNTTGIQYDLAGHKTDMQDPDMGHWTYKYYATGKLQEQVDARTIKTTLTYDDLGRLTGKSYTGSSDATITWNYDAYPSGSPSACSPASTAIGHTTEMKHGGVQEQVSCFDVRGQETATRTVIDSVNYDITRSFNNGGVMTAMTYPIDNESVQYPLSSFGEVTGLTAGSDQLVTDASRTPWGAPSSLPLGISKTTSYSYDYRERLTGIVTGTGSAPPQNLSMSYDDASNITAVTDTGNGASETATYTYDALNRLTGMKIGAAQAATYTYNAIGNMTYKKESLSGQQNSSELTNIGYAPSVVCTAGTRVLPHAVTSTSGTASLGLSYDCNGNLAVQGTSSYTFDAENHLKTRSVTGGTVSYAYDGNGTMRKRTNADTTWTRYIGGIYEVNSDGSIVKYYSVFGRAVAVRKAGALSYLLADHLGSTVGLLDTNGALVTGSPQKYWPYGATRSGGVTQIDKRYTGQQQEPGDSSLDLYNYHARFYSAVTGSFVSSDSVADGLNRYAYVHGDPVGETDFTGHGCQIPPCAVPAPRAGQAPVPTATPSSRPWLEACARNLVACLKFAYGTNSHGMIIVMGWGQSLGRSMEDYADYAKVFLALTQSACGTSVGDCWNAAKSLMTTAGPDAVFDTFGLMFVESDPGGGRVGGAASFAANALTFGEWHLHGTDTLDATLRSGKKEKIDLVVGFSEGAEVVAQYFLRHRDNLTPFFLDAALPTQAATGSDHLVNSVDRSGFGFCCPHENAKEHAADVFLRVAETDRALAGNPVR